MDDIKMLVIHDFLEEEQTNNQQSCIDNFTMIRLSAIASVAVGNYRCPVFLIFCPPLFWLVGFSSIYFLGKSCNLCGFQECAENLHDFLRKHVNIKVSVLHIYDHFLKNAQALTRMLL